MRNAIKYLLFYAQWLAIAQCNVKLIISIKLVGTFFANFLACLIRF